jgi:cell division protein FtsL
MRHQSKPQLRSSRNKLGGASRVLFFFLVVVVAFLAVEIIFFFKSANNLGKGKVEFITPSSDNQKQKTAVSANVNDRRKSTLFKDWLLNVFEAAGKIPTEAMQVVSFRMFDLRRRMGNVEGPPPFFYPVEETLHSATYIVANEIPVLISWMKDLHRAQKEKTTANCLDVGSNGGFFSLMSRSAGCRTLAVDAQPW